MSFDYEELKKLIDLVAVEKNLDPKEIINSIENSIASAYKKEFGEKDKAYMASFDTKTGKYSVKEVVKVVEEVLSPDKEISLLEARLKKPDAEIEDVIETEVMHDQDLHFGRIASQVAKQALIQTLNTIKHNKSLHKFKDKIGEIVNAEVDHYKRGGYVVKVDQASAYLRKEDLLPMDKLKPGQTIKALINDVVEDKTGSHMHLTRTSNDFVIAIISREVPEVASGIVKITKIARSPGFRTKIMVTTAQEEDQPIDPVGTVLGRKNVRILNIMREISVSLQERIDVIEERPLEELSDMIADALEPADIMDIKIDQENKKATVYCTPEDVPLAVGKKGINVRLAGELLGLEINIESSNPSLDSDSNSNLDSNSNSDINPDSNLDSNSNPE